MLVIGLGGLSSSQTKRRLYHAYSFLLLRTVEELIRVPPDMDSFINFYNKVFRSFDYSGSAFFVQRASLVKQIFNFAENDNQFLKDQMRQVAASTPPSHLGQTSKLINIGTYRCAAYSYNIDEFSYIFVITIDLRKFILRGPERSYVIISTIANRLIYVPLAT